MSSTSTNKQPLLIDRPLIEVEVLTTAAVGDSNQDTYRVQGGQGPVLLVDMDRTLSDDDISGGIIDTIELVRNEALPNVDVIIAASGLATQVSYVNGAIVEAASGFFDADQVLDKTTAETIDVNVTSGTESQSVTFASGDLVFIPSGVPVPTEIGVAASGVSIVVSQYDYLYITSSGVVPSGTQLPSGIGVYQHINSQAINGAPATFTYTVASGFRYVGATPGTATLSSGYYLYTGSGFTAYEAVTSYTSASGFTRLGSVSVYYKYPVTIQPFDIIQVTTTNFVNSQTQIPNGIGVYQYTGSTSLSVRPDTINFSASNNFVYLKSTLGSYSNGPGFYKYTGNNLLTSFDRVTNITLANGFEFIGATLSDDFDVVEVCFYHVRQKVNPVANDGDYKFIGSAKLQPNDSRADALLSLPHLSVPVPYAGGTAMTNENGDITRMIDIDKPLKNRGLFLQRGDALYCGIYATNGTAVNYAPGVTVIAQGGYY
jgi:hypothetical protein